MFIYFSLYTVKINPDVDNVRGLQNWNKDRVKDISHMTGGCTCHTNIQWYTRLRTICLYNDESSSHSVKMTYSRVVDVDITFDETVCRGTTEVFNLIIAPHACVEVTIASDVRGRHRTLGTSALKRTLTTHKWYGHILSQTQVEIVSENSHKTDRCRSDLTHQCNWLAPPPSDW
jgi:hypothetical protein